MNKLKEKRKEIVFLNFCKDKSYSVLAQLALYFWYFRFHIILKLPWLLVTLMLMVAYLAVTK